jgi:hypothetical protein
MPRTTLDLDDAVLHELKRRRDHEHKPLGVIASELLAQAFRREPVDERPLAWTAAPLGARVDIDDKDAVWSVLDRG